MTELAHELGIEPMELRRRNWIQHEEFPYTTIAGLTYDSGNYEAATEKALQLFGYDELRREQQERRDRNDPVQLGIGISTYTEMCGLAPSRVLGSLSYGAGGWEAASIRMLPTGKVEVVTGTTPHGQGHVTAWSQIAADALGVPFEDVNVIYGDTRSSPQGMDTYGSRSLVVGGVAVHLAAQKVRREGPAGRRAPAGGGRGRRRVHRRHVLGQGLAGREHHDPGGRAGDVRGAQPARGHGADAQRRRDARPGELLLPARHPPLRGGGRHRDRPPDDPQVRRGRRHRQGDQPADRRGPGARRHRPGHRPGAVRGGGLRRGRQPRHRHDGRLPGARRAPDLPDFVTDRTETPATSNPLGVKGVGEAGTIASTPAVVDAIVDALRPPRRARRPMPCTPERVWRAIHERGSDGGDRAAEGTIATAARRPRPTAGGAE